MQQKHRASEVDYDKQLNHSPSIAVELNDHSNKNKNNKTLIYIRFSLNLEACYTLELCTHHSYNIHTTLKI